MKRKIIIYGNGSFAKLMRYFFSFDSSYQVAAFTVEREFLNGSSFCGLPVIDVVDAKKLYPPDIFDMFVAIGYKNMRNRKKLYDAAKDFDYTFVNYISSQANVSNDLTFGENNVVFPNVTIEPFVKIGNNNVIWSDTLLSHDVIIGNHNYIAAKCLIAGNSIIEDLCFIGNAVVLIDGIRLKNESQLVVGSVIIKDTDECVQYYGNPAKAVGIHKENGIVISR